MDQPAQPNKEQIQESAVAYYNKNRKRSFLFTRITVAASMIVLVIALGVNIFALSEQNQGVYKSEAASKENPVKNLPKIPAGCRYQQLQGGLTVVCPTVTPATDASPINIILPQFPPQCSIQTLASGSAITCSKTNVTIPSSPVTLPASCTIAPQPDKVSCRNNKNQVETIPLPSLPQGCGYTVVADKYYVTCKTK